MCVSKLLLFIGGGGEGAALQTGSEMDQLDTVRESKRKKTARTVGMQHVTVRFDF